jgi:5-methyltetrahydropteroyltriglutamate--homocysteine methyltransferase
VMDRLPLLPTSVVGSHALPGWLVLGREAETAGRLGPVDRRELIEDATRIALLDQIEAGVDVPANGEMGRENFTLGFFGRLAGLRALPAPRRLGVPSYDVHPPYEVVERVSAPEGLGLAEEWRMTRRLTQRPLRATCPGPFTLAIPLRHAGGPYRDRAALLADLADVVNAELRALVEAGADFIQVDEPNFVMLRGADPGSGSSFSTGPWPACWRRSRSTSASGTSTTDPSRRRGNTGRCSPHSSTRAASSSSSSSPTARWPRSS